MDNQTVAFMLVCYLILGLTVCPDGKLPPPNQTYILRDLEKGTEKVQNVLNWYDPRQYEAHGPPSAKPPIRY